MIHGKRNYRRMALVVLYSFYKNFVLVLPNFYFIFYSAGSGSALFDSKLLMGYNVIYTSIPIIVYGAYDWDLDLEHSFRFVQLYWRGINDSEFNLKKCCMWVSKSVYDSLIVFIIAIIAFWLDPVIEYYLQGTIIFLIIVLTVTSTLLVEIKNFNYLIVIVIINSPLLFFPTVFLYDYSGWFNQNLVSISLKLITNMKILILWIAVPIFNLFGYYGIKSLFYLYIPHVVSEARRIQKWKTRETLEVTPPSIILKYY